MSRMVGVPHGQGIWEFFDVSYVSVILKEIGNNSSLLGHLEMTTTFFSYQSDFGLDKNVKIGSFIDILFVFKVALDTL